jgi:hypothetical protein
MKKRGQVTIFIIVAVLLVAIVAVVFIFRENLGLTENTNEQSAPVVNFVQGCVDETFNESIYHVAKNGGYSGYSYLSRESTESGIKYYFFRNSNYMPSKALVEDQIEEYFERKFFLCINQFSNFKDYSVKEGILETSVSIEEDEVVLEAEYPLTITKENSVSRIRDFESEIPSRLSVVYDSVNYFIKEHNTRESLCLGCLSFAVENDIYVDMESSYDGTVVFVFKDNSSELKLNDKPLEWVFANKY